MGGCFGSQSQVQPQKTKLIKMHTQKSAKEYEEKGDNGSQNTIDFTDQSFEGTLLQGQNLFYLGQLYYSQSQPEQALSCYKRCLAIRTKQLGLKHLETTAVIQRLGLLYLSLNQFKKAFTYFESFLNISSEVYGQEHKQTAIAQENLGQYYYTIEEYQKALENFEQGLKIRQLLKQNQLNQADLYIKIAETQDKLGKKLLSLENYQKALEIHQQILGLNNETTKGLITKIENLRSQISEK